MLAHRIKHIMVPGKSVTQSWVQVSKGLLLLKKCSTKNIKRCSRTKTNETAIRKNTQRNHTGDAYTNLLAETKSCNEFRDSEATSFFLWHFHFRHNCNNYRRHIGGTQSFSSATVAKKTRACKPLCADFPVEIHGLQSHWHMNVVYFCIFILYLFKLSVPPNMATWSCSFSLIRPIPTSLHLKYS